MVYEILPLDCKEHRGSATVMQCDIYKPTSTPLLHPPASITAIYFLKGGFFRICKLLNTATSAAAQIPLCPKMLRLDRTQDCCDFDVGSQTL